MKPIAMIGALITIGVALFVVSKLTAPTSAVQEVAVAPPTPPPAAEPKTEGTEPKEDPEKPVRKRTKAAKKPAAKAKAPPAKDGAKRTLVPQLPRKS